MIGLVLTLDYEVYGDGTGNLKDHVVDPTRDFLAVCERYGGRGTLFVEVVELIRMKEHKYFADDLLAVEEQLKEAHEKGHDVQLHIHPWWFRAQFREGKWEMDYKMSSLCYLKANVALGYIRLCKDYLTELFKQCDRDYSCIAFRAGSWSMMPTYNMFEALVMAGIEIESSVYKWGIMDTEHMKHDYSNAYSNLHPWFFSREDVNKVAKCYTDGCRCLEIPIYAEHQRGIRFLTRKRVSLMSKVRSAIVENDPSDKQVSAQSVLFGKFNLLIRKKAKKLDFCKCTFREMKKMTQNIVSYNPSAGYMPAVAIGHSKDLIFKEDLRKFLSLLKSKYADIIEVVPLTVAAKRYRSSSKFVL